MSETPFRNQELTRRQLLQTAAVLGAAGGAGLGLQAEAAAAVRGGKTAPLSAEEMAAVDAALGKKGKAVEAEALYTTPLPRNDLKMSIKGVPVPIPFGFGGWVSLKKMQDGKSTMLMSDCVLLQEEVNPVISAAQAHGLEVVALHNHFFYEEPRIFFMHLMGMGSPADLARAFAAAIAPSKLLPANQPPAGPPPARTGRDIFDLPALDRIVGHTGAVNGPTYKYTVGRPDLTVISMGAVMTPAIGLNSWAAFAGTPDTAHVAGDMAMLPAEVNPVIHALRQHNLEVVAVHNHMIDDNPRIIFLHYYGTGPATALAQGFRAALDQLGRRGGGRQRQRREDG